MPLDSRDDGSSDLCFSESGTLAAVTTNSGQISLWDLESDQITDEIQIGRSIYRATFADQDRIIVAYSDRKVIAYELISGEVLATVDLSSVPQTLLVPKAGDAFYVGTRSGEIIVLDFSVPSVRSVRSVDAHQGRINALAMFPNGRRMVSAGRDQVLRLWDVESLELVGTLTGHDRQIFAVAISPDGRCIASGGLAGDLRLWRSGPR